RFHDFDLLQHLANDHFDVLVVNQHALQAIDFLDLVDEVARQFLDALDGKDVVRSGVAVQDVLALLDGIAFLEMERLALRDQVFDRICTVLGRLDDDATLVLVVAAEADGTIDLGDDGVILRTTGFEQLGHTRQTAGDVLGLGALERNTRENVTGDDLFTGLNGDNRIHRQQVAGIATTVDLGHRTATGDSDSGLEALTALVAAPVDDDALGEAGRLIGVFRNRCTVDQILEQDLAFDFGQDRT